MSKPIPLVFFSALAGLALGAAGVWLALPSGAAPSPTSEERPTDGRDAARQRLLDLEALIETERARSAEHERRLDALTTQLEALAERLETETTGNDREQAVASMARPNGRAAPEPDPPALDPSLPPQVARLVAGGFDPDRAEWIVRRQSELEMEALERRYQASRSGEPLTAEWFTSREAALREELGDEDYERYRQATGRPTRVRIDQVLAGSPAEEVGIVPGDEILSYDGERVFDMMDLRRLTLAGEPGRSVTLRLRRGDDDRVVSLPRGPIGVQTQGSYGHTSSER